jgi:uncharacterized protein (DUF362 family)
MIIRWVCDKDNKKWLYPISTCIYCKGPIKKQISKTAKIIGITKVNIPSPMHPIIPYNIVLLEDEYGNRMPKKTMKNYRIGDTFAIEKAKTDSAVIITKVKYYLNDAVKDSLDLLTSLDLEKEDKVLITPCLLEPAYPYQAVNTNPDLLEVIISLLKERGIEDIAVGTQAMLSNDTAASAKKAGLIDVCKKHQIRIIDFSDREYVETEADGMKFNVAKEILDRKVINLPVMKINSQIGVSGAMENMIRVTDEKTQKEMFSDDIEKTLPKLIKAVPKFLTVGDATLGMVGQGPTKLGEPAFLNMVLIGKDPVAIDSVFAEIGMSPLPKYLKEASKIGTGKIFSKESEIVGEEVEAIKYPLKPANKEASAHSKIKIIEGKANPYIFSTANKMISKLVGLGGYETNVAIGKFITEDMVGGKERVIAYGNDAINKLKELNVYIAAEILEDANDVEKIVLLKSILEDPNKKRASTKDKIKSKLMGLRKKLRGQL